MDALQSGFRPIVVRECVGDRHAGPHAANLADLDRDWADVVSLAKARRYLAGLRRGSRA